jgi:hypothetical protein
MWRLRHNTAFSGLKKRLAEEALRIFFEVREV